MGKNPKKASASTRKIDAIFDLRMAAENKGRNERALAEQPSPEGRQKLLDSMLEVEEKTATAIAACHECGQDHAPSEPHASSIP